MLKRYHLIEIADQRWCPSAVRDGVTDYLQFAIVLSKAYAASEKPLANALRETGVRRVVDLCSGGGGPWLALRKALETDLGDIYVTLTDYHPNVESFRRIEQQSAGKIHGLSESVDAQSPSEQLTGFRTIFSAFHHFRPDEARKVLSDAVQHSEGIAIFEATHRSVQAIVVTLLAPILVLLCTPFIRPFRMSRLFWTYIIPAIPLVVLFDGIVSCLRTYTPGELLELTKGIGDEKYRWNADELRVKSGALPVTCLMGYRRDT